MSSCVEYDHNMKCSMLYMYGLNWKAYSNLVDNVHDKQVQI